MIDRLIDFVDNGGRLRANEEPRYGEPFYGDYLKQYLTDHYQPGDRVNIVTDRKTYEGILLKLGYEIELLTSGKNHRNV